MLRQKFLKNILLFTSLIILLLIALIFYVTVFEPNNLKKTYFIIETEKYSTLFHPIKIIHLTDFHIDKIGYRERKVLKIVKEEEPEMILLSGDYLNDRDKLLELESYIHQLVLIAPTYFTLGNWDNVEIFRTLKKAGAISVFEKDELVYIKNFQLNIFSIKMPWSFKPFEVEEKHFLEIFKGSQETFSLFLIHTPDHFPVAVKYKIDLVLAGHTHGGQFRLPFFGSRFKYSKFGKKYESGIFYDGQSCMYVNRGIGMTGNVRYRMRSLCPPEILIITIKPKKKL